MTLGTMAIQLLYLTTVDVLAKIPIAMLPQSFHHGHSVPCLKCQPCVEQNMPFLCSGVVVIYDTLIATSVQKLWPCLPLFKIVK